MFKSHYLSHNLCRFVFLLSILLVGAYSQGQSCINTFSKHYWQGERVSETKSELFYRLGEGVEGGVVYRVISKKTGNSHLRKVYNHSNRRTHDEASLKVLWELTQKIDGVEVLMPLGTEGDKVLLFQDVKGFPLHRPPEELTFATQRSLFLYWTLKVMEAAKKNPDMETNYLGKYHYIITYRIPQSRHQEFHGLKFIDIMLKDDNVIVDIINKRMVIFDPY
jgi:hypothetical protein